MVTGIPCSGIYTGYACVLYVRREKLWQKKSIKEIYTELANRIYDLDGEVYRVLGSSLGRTFTGNRDSNDPYIKYADVHKTGRTSSPKRTGTDQ